MGVKHSLFRSIRRQYSKENTVFGAKKEKNLGYYIMRSFVFYTSYLKFLGQ
jgi:hypothetical protein